jgi:hypothetical protein
VIRIASSTLVSAPRPLVFAFLADRDNHWHLAGRGIELLEIGEEADRRLSGLVLIRGPLGVRRRARTRVLDVREPALLGGVARVGRGTIAEVRWNLRDAAPSGTRVELSASVSAADRLDRALLALGGGFWMARLFDSTLSRLAERLDGAETPASLQPA